MRIDDAILSGSVVGSAATVSLTGSFTGSGHVATASFLLGTVESASYAVTASHAITASYALNVDSFTFKTQDETANFNFVKDTFHVVSQSAITGTLPTTPDVGDRVAFMKVGTTSSLIGRGGSNIMYLGEDLTVDSNNASFSLIYSGATPGWILLGANN